MSIERIENGERFCRVLRHNGTVYLAGPSRSWNEYGE